MKRGSKIWMDVTGITAVVAAVVLSVAGCTSNVSDGLIDEIERTNGVGIQLDSVVGGEWEQFLVICPYSGNVEDKLGFDWDGAPDTLDADVQTIAFIQDSTVTDSVTVSLRTVNLCSRSWGVETRAFTIDFSPIGDGRWEASA